MTRAAEDARVKPVRAPWRLGESWLNARTLAAGAGLSILALFAALFLMLREKPMPRRADVPPAKIEARVAAAQEQLKENPQDLAALVELGTLLFQKGKDSYVDAMNALEEARELGALDPRIFYCLGVMYQEEGLLPFALSEYKRFLRHYPEDKEVRLLSAKLFYRMGLFPEAVGEYERLKYAHPDDPIVEENLGLSLRAAKQGERARASFTQLREHGGEFARRAEYYLAELALEDGKFETAAGHFARLEPAKGLPQGLEEGKVHASMGMTLQKLNRLDEAKAAWEAALKAVPGDAKAQAALRELNRRIAAAKKAAAKKK